MAKRKTPRTKPAKKEPVTITPALTPEQKRQVVDIYQTFRKHFSKKRRAK